MEKNYFSELYQIDVSGKTEKKNGLTYLSWAWAWAELKKLHPDATYQIYEDATGCFYHTDGRTCWVKTGVTVAGIEHIEYLPVMDLRNRSIPADQVTSFDVNKAIQRSLTKAVARHGLGLYVYAGEDLPEDAEEAPKSRAGAKRGARATNSTTSEQNRADEAPVASGEVLMMTREHIEALSALAKTKFGDKAGIKFKEITGISSLLMVADSRFGELRRQILQAPAI